MKKIISIITAILIISNLCVLSFAKEHDGYLVLSDNNIMVAVGKTVRVPIYIENNMGIMGFKIIVAYDSDVLKPLSVERGEVTKSGMLNDNIDVAIENEFYVIWSDNGDTNTNGTLFYVNFLVLQTAEQSTTIDITYSQDDTFNEDWEDVVLECGNITLGITGQSEYNPDDPIIIPSVDGEAVVFSNDISCDAGAVLIPVYIKNNPGMMGYKLIFDYDTNVIEPISVSCAETMSGSFDSNIGLRQGTFTVVWNSTENYSDDGLLFSLIVNVKNVDETQITISYSQDDTFDESWEEVILSCENIKINHLSLYR